MCLLPSAWEGCTAQVRSNQDASANENAALVARLARILSKSASDPDLVAREIPGKIEPSSAGDRIIAAPNLKTVIRIAESGSRSSVAEIEMHFDLNVQLRLKHLSRQLGTPVTVSESETSSVRWNAAPGSTTVVYATLFSSKAGPEAIVTLVRMRPDRAR